MLDYLLTGATLFDGIGKRARRDVDVGVLDERIAYVGPPLGPGAARSVVDADSLFLCPGFIDSHASTGLGYRFPNAGDHKLHQGVTTEIIGNCGTSPAPIGPHLVPTMEALSREIGFCFDWRSLSQWSEGIQMHGLPFNVGTLIGHSTLRAGVSSETGRVRRLEIYLMTVLLNQALDEGGLGLSTGLVYAPGSFAETWELIELARVAARKGGIYCSHVRDERENLEDSIEEAIEIGRQAALPVLVSHLKSAERPNWGRIPAVIERFEEALSQGVRINFEVYPYTAASTKLRTFLPKSLLSDGLEGMVQRLKTSRWRRRSVDWLRGRGTDFDSMVLITESLERTRGRSISEVAARRKTDPAHAVVDILVSDPDAWIVYDCMDQDDVDAAVLWEGSIICSDSWSYPVNAPVQIGEPHPRTFGAFTRFLEKYALGEARIPFGEAIRKITSFPARWFNLAGRGAVREGFFADLVLLDPTSVQERATFRDPRRFSEGTVQVWVNGKPLLKDGRVVAGSLPGKFLRPAPTRG